MGNREAHEKDLCQVPGLLLHIFCLVVLVMK